jgi:hypothetical protein
VTDTRVLLDGALARGADFQNLWPARGGASDSLLAEILADLGSAAADL